MVGPAGSHFLQPAKSTQEFGQIVADLGHQGFDPIALFALEEIPLQPVVTFYVAG